MALFTVRSVTHVSAAYYVWFEAMSQLVSVEEYGKNLGVKFKGEWALDDVVKILNV